MVAMHVNDRHWPIRECSDGLGIAMDIAGNDQHISISGFDYAIAWKFLLKKFQVKVRGNLDFHSLMKQDARNKTPSKLSNTKTIHSYPLISAFNLAIQVSPLAWLPIATLYSGLCGLFVLKTRMLLS